MSEASSPDTTFLSLVPRRSKRRNVAAAVLGVVVLVAAWFSPVILRPTLTDGGGTNGSLTGVGGNELVTVMTIHPAAWPYGTVESIDDVSGAHVTGAWLLPTPGGGSEPDLGDGRAFASGASFLAASPYGPRLPGAGLPQKFTTSTVASLVLVWHVDDCRAVVTAKAPTAQVRSAFGLTSSVPLDAISGPGWTMGLPEIGVCTGTG